MIGGLCEKFEKIIIDLDETTALVKDLASANMQIKVLEAASKLTESVFIDKLANMHFEIKELEATEKPLTRPPHINTHGFGRCRPTPEGGVFVREDLEEVPALQREVKKLKNIITSLEKDIRVMDEELAKVKCKYVDIPPRPWQRN